MLGKKTVIVVGVLSFMAVAISTGTVLAAKNISGSYDSTTELANGTVVSLTKGLSDTVEPANSNNASRIIGAVVAFDNSLIAVDPDAQRAQVANTGSAYVLVSTLNGKVMSGDRIAVSPISGIGMKRVQSGGYIVGVAEENFASSVKSTKTQQVKDKDGKQNTVTVGYVKTLISPRFDGDDKEQSLTGLQSLVRSLTGHVVSTPRIIASALIAVVTLIGVGVLLYASIYGSIVSIGRNPLAKDSILTALLQSLLMVLAAVGLAFLAIFMLLR